MVESALKGRAAAIEPVYGLTETQRDALTGLPTEEFFKAKLAACLKLCRSQPIAATLALLQLENFYEIRSWVGPAEANLLLSDISQLLQKSLPPTATLCRCQHYEFAVLLSNDCSLNAELITDRIKSALQSAVSSTIPPQLELKCVVGLAVLNKETPTSDVLFAKARHSISQTHFANRSADAGPLPKWQELQTLLHKALRENSLQLSFQPTAALLEDGLEHYEVRCRLPDSDPAIPAGLMFEQATQNAMGEVIDRWVILKSMRVLREQKNHKLRFTINITLNSLVSSSYMLWLQATFDQTASVAQQLQFQISEIDVLIAQHHLQNFSEGVKQLGIKLCIGHFGCTTDPFRYLPLLRVHCVKLDESRLESIQHKAQRRAQLEQLVADLDERGIKVIAAMVKEMELLPLLWAAGVGFVQGNCLQAPDTELNFRFLEDQSLGMG